MKKTLMDVVQLAESVGLDVQVSIEDNISLVIFATERAPRMRSGDCVIHASAVIDAAGDIVGYDRFVEQCMTWRCHTRAGDPSGKVAA